jgi:transcriptional regulator with XRE-family HTH domain
MMLDIDKIRLRRLELRLSQRALGQAIRQDQAYVSRVENGIIKDVTADTLWRLSRTLDVPMEDLLILDAEDKTIPPAKPRQNGRKPPVTKPAAKAKATAPKRTRTPARAAKG